MDRTVPDRPMAGGADRLSSEELRRKKTSLTLDFGSARDPGAAAKNPKQEFREGILCSPDVGLLALATPDLERFIMQQAYGAAAAATTPPGAAAASIVTTPTQLLFPRTVTEEQEAYARGFLDALVELHRQQQVATSPHLQVVPDHRGTVLLPRASPSDEVQNSLYPTPTSTSYPPVVSVAADAAAKRPVPEFVPVPEIPFSGLRPSTLDLSPAARRSAVLPMPAFGSKRFIPFVDDNETLDLSPSGRFASRTLENSTSQGMPRPSHNQPASSTSSLVHHPVEVDRAVDNTLHPVATVNGERSTETRTERPSSENASIETRMEVQDQTNSASTSDLPGSLLPTRPIDMSVQELAKLERKREKNRHAAQKCRMLKLERISRLQQRVDELKRQNEQFANTAGTLREQVLKLRQMIVEHVEGGCQVMMVRSVST